MGGAASRVIGVDRMKRAFHRMGLWLPFFVLVLGLLTSLWGERGLLANQALSEQISHEEAQLARIREDNTSLSRRIASLRQDPHEVERLIRDEMNYLREGEVAYVFGEGDPSPVPAANPTRSEEHTPGGGRAVPSTSLAVPEEMGGSHSSAASSLSVSPSLASHSSSGH